MRELKFRAWDKNQEKMLYGVSIGTVKVWDENAPFIGHEFSYSGDCIFEQYTGLKDKNGKEIYEGDIIQEEIDFNSTMTDGTFKYRVYWDEEELCWVLDPIGKESIHNELWQCNSSIEVVGNIHEGEDKK